LSELLDALALLVEQGLRALDVLQHLLDHRPPDVGRFGHVVVELLAQGERRFERLRRFSESIAVRHHLDRTELQLGESDLVLRVLHRFVGGDQERVRLLLGLLGLVGVRFGGLPLAPARRVPAPEPPPADDQHRKPDEREQQARADAPGQARSGVCFGDPARAGHDRTGKVAAHQQRLDPR
jgi:hypothetical protein